MCHLVLSIVVRPGFLASGIRCICLESGSITCTKLLIVESSVRLIVTPEELLPGQRSYRAEGWLAHGRFMRIGATEVGLSGVLTCRRGIGPEKSYASPARKRPVSEIS